MLDYRTGPVYEIESGARLYQGKRITAERYLDYYDNLPLVCISMLQGYGLQAWMEFDNFQDEKWSRSFEQLSPVAKRDHRGYAACICANGNAAKYASSGVAWLCA